MRERPIIFSRPMVRAILAGTKTQTRRMVKQFPTGGIERTLDDGRTFINGTGSGPVAPLCPYGKPGDRLWVRETWLQTDDPREVQYIPVRYRATDTAQESCKGYWRPSIHMPRWARRITLQIEGVRVERLNEISTDDIRSEGVDLTGLTTSTGIRNAWVSLWNSIHGPDAWERNDWVWALTFRRITP